MATYDVRGRINHNGTIYEVGDSFDSDDDKVIATLKESGALGRKLADVTVDSKPVTKSAPGGGSDALPTVEELITGNGKPKLIEEAKALGVEGLDYDDQATTKRVIAEAIVAKRDAQ